MSMRRLRRRWGRYGRAVAISPTAPAGVADANAAISTGIVFTGIADQVALTYDNSNPMLIQAGASAVGSTVADADATIGFGFASGLWRRRGSRCDVRRELHGCRDCGANAFRSRLQSAIASYTDNGTLDVDAVALAVGPVAIANATVSFALAQVAAGSTLAVASLDNNGSIDADAIAIAAGTVFASANALVNDVVIQNASATGAAVASISNNGLISAKRLQAHPMRSRTHRSPMSSSKLLLPALPSRRSTTRPSPRFPAARLRTPSRRLARNGQCQYRNHHRPERQWLDIRACDDLERRLYRRTRQCER